MTRAPCVAGCSVSVVTTRLFRTAVKAFNEDGETYVLIDLWEADHV